MRKGKAGEATSTVEVSPAWSRRQARQRRAEEREWRARNGPVTVTRMPGCDENHTAPDLPEGVAEAADEH